MAHETRFKFFHIENNGHITAVFRKYRFDSDGAPSDVKNETIQMHPGCDHQAILADKEVNLLKERFGAFRFEEIEAVISTCAFFHTPLVVATYNVATARQMMAELATQDSENPKTIDELNVWGPKLASANVDLEIIKAELAG